MSWWVLGHYVLSLWFSSLHIKKQCSGPCEGMHDCAPFVLEQSAYINCREFFCIEDLPLSLTHLFFFFFLSFARLHECMDTSFIMINFPLPVTSYCPWSYWSLYIWNHFFLLYLCLFDTSHYIIPVFLFSYFWVFFFFLPGIRSYPKHLILFYWI